MTKSINILFAFILITFVACNEQSSLLQSSEKLEKRTATGITIEVLLADGSKVHLSATDFSAQYSTSDEITLVVNQGGESTSTYTAAEFDAYQYDDALSITKNPGSSQTVYDSKNHLHVSTNTSGQLALDISEGSISTTASSLIGEETEGL